MFRKRRHEKNRKGIMPNKLLTPPLYSIKMTRFFLVFVVVVSLGCTRQYNVSTQNTDDAVIFFADLNKTYYELGPPIQEVSNKNQPVETSLQAFNGNFAQVNNLTIQETDTYKVNTQKVDSYSDKIYAITKHNSLVVESNGGATTIIERIYPPPSQVVNVNDVYVYYHDNLYIYSIHISSKTIVKLLDTPMPIHTIDVDRNTQNIYFSLSTSGDIYQLSHSGRLNKVHAPVTAIGGPVNYQESTKELYFTVSNGRDTAIQSISTEYGTVSDHATIFQRISLSELHIIPVTK